MYEIINTSPKTTSSAKRDEGDVGRGRSGAQRNGVPRTPHTHPIKKRLTHVNVRFFFFDYRGYGYCAFTIATDKKKSFTPFFLIVFG